MLSEKVQWMTTKKNNNASLNAISIKELAPNKVLLRAFQTRRQQGVNQNTPHDPYLQHILFPQAKARARFSQPLEGTSVCSCTMSLRKKLHYVNIKSFLERTHFKVRIDFTLFFFCSAKAVRIYIYIYMLCYLQSLCWAGCSLPHIFPLLQRYITMI